VRFLVFSRAHDVARLYLESFDEFLLGQIIVFYHYLFVVVILVHEYSSVFEKVLAQKPIEELEFEERIFEDHGIAVHHQVSFLIFLSHCHIVVRGTLITLIVTKDEWEA